MQAWQGCQAVETAKNRIKNIGLNKEIAIEIVR